MNFHSNLKYFFVPRLSDTNSSTIKWTNAAALPRQNEVMTIFMFLRYGTKTKFCLIYPII